MEMCELSAGFAIEVEIRVSKMEFPGSKTCERFEFFNKMRLVEIAVSVSMFCEADLLGTAQIGKCRLKPDKPDKLFGRFPDVFRKFPF